MADVLISETARDKLDSLPPNVKDRITGKLLDEVADDPGRYCKPLGGTDEYRVRVGDYRVRLDWDRRNDTLKITDVGKRDGFYD